MFANSSSKAKKKSSAKKVKENKESANKDDGFVESDDSDNSLLFEGKKVEDMRFVGWNLLKNFNISRKNDT